VTELAIKFVVTKILVTKTIATDFYLVAK